MCKSSTFSFGRLRRAFHGRLHKSQTARAEFTQNSSPSSFPESLRGYDSALSCSDETIGTTAANDGIRNASMSRQGCANINTSATAETDIHMSTPNPSTAAPAAPATATQPQSASAPASPALPAPPAVTAPPSSSPQPQQKPITPAPGRARKPRAGRNH